LAMSKYIATAGNPSVVQCDDANVFKGHEFNALASKEGFKIEGGSAHNQKSDGMAESMVDRCKNQLISRTMTANASEWDVHLDDALRTIRRTISSSRGHSPFELMFGVKPMLAAQRRLGVAHDEAPIMDESKHIELVQQRVRELEQEANNIRKKRHDSNARRVERVGVARDLKVGDVAMIWNNSNTHGSKFANRVRQTGPYKVTDIDAATGRVSLVNLESGIPLKEKVARDRVVPVRPGAVVSLPVVGEPGERSWQGKGDVSLLSDAERKRVVRQQAKVANAAIQQRATTQQQKTAEEKKNERWRKQQSNPCTAVAPENGVAVAGKYLQAGHTLFVQTPGKEDGVWVLAKNCSEEIRRAYRTQKRSSKSTRGDENVSASGARRLRV